MNDALYVAATGMHAHQSNVDLIANNVANINTATFKKGHVVFQDLLSRAGAAAEDGSALRAGGLAGERGIGVNVAHVAKTFSQGELRRTESSLDLAIQGEGFIEVLLPDGSTGLTRGGTLQVTADGTLATAEGHPLKAGISVPADTQRLTISANGVVSSMNGPDAGSARELGSIELVMVPNPQELQAMGGSLYKAPEDGARLVAAAAGESGAGLFVQGALELSNVVMTDELVALMVAQRAYELNVKVMQAADEMVGMSNNLRRG